MSEAAATFDLFDSAIKRRLQRLIDAGQKPDRLWDAVGERLAESIDLNFERQGRPDPWPSLSLDYLWRVGTRGKSGHNKRGEIKKGALRRMQGKKILIARGRLRRSIAYRHFGTVFQIGSNLVYAAIHQFGGVMRHFTMKARPYIVLQDDDRAGILNEDVPRFLELAS